MNSRIVTLCTVLMACGCATNAPGSQRADQLARQGQYDEADEAYAKAMDGYDLARSEWEYFAKKRCASRKISARKAIEKLESDPAETVDPAELDALEDLVLPCDWWQEFYPRIRALHSEAIERKFVEEVEPLFSVGSYYKGFEAARQWTADLDPEHPRRLWLEERRRELAEKFGQKQPELSAVPVAVKAIAALQSGLGFETAVPTDFSAETQKYLAAHRATSAPFVPSIECSGVADWKSVPATSGGAGKPYTVTSLVVDGCTENTRIDMIEETYVEYVETEQEVVKVRYEQVERTRKTVIQKRNCYTSSNGFGSGCVDAGATVKRETYYETVPVYYTVIELVSVPVQKTRPMRQRTTEVSADIVATVKVGDITQTIQRSFSSAAKSRSVPAGTSDSQVPRTDAWQDLRAEATQAAPAFLDEAARGVRIKELDQLASSAIESGEENAAIEYVTLLWIAGGDLDTTKASLLEQTFGYPLARSNGIPIVADFEWKSVAHQRAWIYRPRFREFEGALAIGYPIAAAGVGGRYRSPRQLVGQPSRAAGELALDAVFRTSIMSDSYHRGWGVAFGVDLYLGGGARLGEPYEPVEPLGTVQDEASGIALSFGGALPVLVGTRTDFLGAFVGVRPLYDNFAIGEYLSEGGAIPLSGRLEIRFDARLPIILEAWGGNLTGEFGSILGGVLDIPVGEGLWLSTRGKLQSLPAEIPGLNVQDEVYVDSAEFYEMGVSITSGF